MNHGNNLLWRVWSVLLRTALVPAIAWAAVWMHGQMFTAMRPDAAEPLALRPGEFRGPSPAELIGACNDAGLDNPPDVLDGEALVSRGRWRIAPEFHPRPPRLAQGGRAKRMGRSGPTP